MDLNIGLEKRPPPKLAKGNRRRSNSQSQVLQQVNIPNNYTKEKRNLNEYYVILTSLNDTFEEKRLHVPYFPDVVKLGRPLAARTKPEVTNGFFDSRVLSRNHAAMFFDAALDRIMIKDLGSSNGTYVNDVKIGDEPVPIDVGDTIHLGFYFQMESQHKQIRAKVKNINISANFFPTASVSFDKENGVNFKHFDYIQDIFLHLPEKKKAPVKKDSVLFDNALFSDINPTLEDSLLGISNRVSTGIFNNAHITNPATLEATINLLTTNLLKVKQQTHILKSLESFVTNYLKRLDELNAQRIESEVALKQGEFDLQLQEIKREAESLAAANENLKQQLASAADYKRQAADLKRQLADRDERPERVEPKKPALFALTSATTTSTSNVHAVAAPSDTHFDAAHTIGQLDPEPEKDEFVFASQDEAKLTPPASDTEADVAEAPAVPQLVAVAHAHPIPSLTLVSVAVALVGYILYRTIS